MTKVKFYHIPAMATIMSENFTIVKWDSSTEISTFSSERCFHEFKISLLYPYQYFN